VESGEAAALGATRRRGTRRAGWVESRAASREPPLVERVTVPVAGSAGRRL